MTPATPPRAPAAAQRHPPANRGLRALVRALGSPFSVFLQHRDLVGELVRREIIGRYRGANLGLLWSLLGPLLMLVIYTVAFGQIFGSRWQQGTGDTAAFGLVLFLGIMVHGFFAECLTRAPRHVVENANYVKRVVFPVHVLSWVTVLSGAFHLLMNLVVFAVLCLFINGSFSPWIVLVPLVVAPLALMTVGVCWVVSSLGVYVRDLQQAVPVVATAMLFLSSAIIPVDALSPRYQAIFRANPLTFFIDQVREVALWGRLPDWEGLGLRYVVALVIVYACYAWFRAVRRGFADVL